MIITLDLTQSEKDALASIISLGVTRFTEVSNSEQAKAYAIVIHGKVLEQLA